MVSARSIFRLMLVAAVLGVLSPPFLSAAPKKAPAEKEAKLDTEALRAALKSGQEASVLSALDELRRAPKQAASLEGELGSLLANGSNPKVVLSALRTARAVATPGLSQSVAPYVRHRSSRVRHTAAEALAQSGGPIAIATFRSALRGSDPKLRNLAARALGSLGATQAVGDLFLALDHGVSEAARSIGTLCEGEDCQKFAARAGKLPLEVITSGAEPILLRVSAGVSDELKLQLIGRLAAFATSSATEFLLLIHSRWPEGGSAAVKKALRQAVLENGGELPK
jgi:hypothetical protein